MTYRKIQFCLYLLIILPIISLSQEKDTISISTILKEVNISGVSAGETTPMSYTNVSKEEIEKNNLGQDIPYIMSLTPSIVSSSDAGAGIGYTYMTIRGSDASRINITINGIPVNDSESQGVWWVNMPDLASSTQNIQIQRGVGTSTNGGSAFGASVNLQTNGLQENRYFTTSNSIGSYNSLKNNIEFGTGLLNDKWSLDARLSKISSDGYIDRASSDLTSGYLSLGYYGKSESLNAIIFGGHERTYQSWYGVPKTYIDSHPTFNPYNYENEVDNYNQNHFQLHYNKTLNNNTFLKAATHYTKGFGYYEQYIGKNHNSILYNGDYIYGENTLNFYGLDNIIVNEDTITTANLTRRKWLDNDFYGMIFSLHHKYSKLDMILGGGINRYNGDHFGKVISLEYADHNGVPQEFNNLDHEYYRNDAIKNDQNIYLKIDYSINNNLHLYGDFQNRSIQYHFEGLNDDTIFSDQSINLNFMNPKFGIFYSLSPYSSVYTSYAIANKEPNRDDYRESPPSDRPDHETLYDTELGWKMQYDNISMQINLYHMSYNNQLVKTGEINDVGESVHSNIKDSYRQGLEIESSINISPRLQWNGNICLSKNKIISHNDHIDNWDNWGAELTHYENTDIAFSPNIIASAEINYGIKNIEAAWIIKHVGKQYIDNTQSEERILDAYSINNLLLSYDLKFKNIKTASIRLQINNILDHQYANRAWVYRFISEGWDPRGSDPYINKDSDGYNMTGYFPQAGRNYMLGFSVNL